MAQTRSEATKDLPPGVIARRRSNATYYYYQTSSTKGPRTEHPLGKNKAVAISLWRSFAEVDPLEKSKIPIQPWIAQALFRATTRNAKKRNIPCDITLDDVTTLVIESKGRCSVTGIEFDLFKDPSMRARPWAPSIDRIDCRSGYHKENVRLVANAVNIALNDFGDEVLLRIARGIVKVSLGRNV